ncbi:Pyrimidine-nucleoside phosphorylase [compost metagenome]
MTERETAQLTKAMTDTGDIIDLSSIKGKIVDKHSSGGVGDKTTFVVSPMVAACGLPVAKMSGRGLGFGGGTVDKLESIMGFRTSITSEDFEKFVNEDGISIMGQSGKIAPADKKTYALRDVTATVDSIPLIASSIMSKKLADGSDSIVLDVKVGSGAFMKTVDEAIALAKEMVKIGENNAKRTIAAVTNMDEPLGIAVGNSNEVEEAVLSLLGQGPEDFMEVCYTIGSLMLIAGEKAKDMETARKMLETVLNNGAAYEKFKKFIDNQGGDTSVIENTKKLPKAKYILKAKAERSGYVTKINAETIGRSTVILGAGRNTKEDIIDHAVGAMIYKKVGDQVEKGEVLFEILTNDERLGEKALLMALDAYSIGGKQEIDKKPIIIAIVDKNGVEKFI